jgi:hypothetical protein
MDVDSRFVEFHEEFRSLGRYRARPKLLMF